MIVACFCCRVALVFLRLLNVGLGVHGFSVSSHRNAHDIYRELRVRGQVREGFQGLSEDSGCELVARCQYACIKECHFLLHIRAHVT